MRFCWSKEIPLSKVEQELRKAADFALISVGEELTDESTSPENKTVQNRAEGKWQQERAALQKRLDELQAPSGRRGPLEPENIRKQGKQIYLS